MILIIDGNSLLNVVTTSTIYSSNNSDLSRPFFRSMDKWVIKSTSAEYYDSQIYRYLLGIITSFPYITSIYIASDSTSWRKIYYKKKLSLFEGRPDYSSIESGYKGNRKIDSEQKEQNIELIKYLTSETILRLSQKIPGINLISVKGLEGDDIVYRLVERLKQNQDVVVWSNDSDLHQLLDKNVFVIGSFDKTTKARRLFQLNEEVEETKSNNRVMTFNFIDNKNENNTKNVITSLIQRGFYSNNYCDPHYDLITKILCGDKKSDNIPPVFSFCRDGKVTNLTQVKFSDKIYEYLKGAGYTGKTIVDGFKTYDSSIMTMIIEKICELFKVSYNEYSSKIEEYLKFNIRMIILDKNMIPTQILEYLDEVIDYIENKHSAFNEAEYRNFVKPYILEKI